MTWPSGWSNWNARRKRPRNGRDPDEREVKGGRMAMMKSFKRRMDRLVAQIGAEAGCPVCGRRTGKPMEGVPVKIYFDGESTDHTPNHCPGCGVLQVIRITFDD